MATGTLVIHLVRKLYDNINNGKVDFVSFDIETGGDDCGIVQLSTECFILASLASV